MATPYKLLCETGATMTDALEIPGQGCIVRSSVQPLGADAIAMAMVFVPGAKVVEELEMHDGKAVVVGHRLVGR